MPFDRHHYAKWSTSKQIETKLTETSDTYTLQELRAALQIKARPLPPDPDDKNSDRAADADIAIRIFRAETGTDEDDAVVRLLACLMHWCDRYGFVFNDELERARKHYETETMPAEDAGGGCRVMKIADIKTDDVLVSVDKNGAGSYRVVKVNRVTVDVVGENGNKVRAYPHMFDRKISDVARLHTEGIRI